MALRIQKPVLIFALLISTNLFCQNSAESRGVLPLKNERRSNGGVLKELPETDSDTGDNDNDHPNYDFFEINDQMRNYKENLLLANENDLQNDQQQPQEMEQMKLKTKEIHGNQQEKETWRTQQDFYDDAATEGLMKRHHFFGTDDNAQIAAGVYPDHRVVDDPYAAKPFPYNEFVIDHPNYYPRSSSGPDILSLPVRRLDKMMKPGGPAPIPTNDQNKNSYKDSDGIEIPLPFLDIFNKTKKAENNNIKKPIKRQSDVLETPSIQENNSIPDPINTATAPKNTKSEIENAADELKSKAVENKTAEPANDAENSELKTDLINRNVENSINPAAVARIRSTQEPMAQVLGQKDDLEQRKTRNQESMAVNETATTQIDSSETPIVIPKKRVNGKDESTIAEKVNNSSKSTLVNGVENENQGSEPSIKIRIQNTAAVNGTVAVVKDAKMIQNGSRITMIDGNGTVLYTHELPAGLRIVHYNASLAEEQFAKGILKADRFDDGGIRPKTEIGNGGNEYTLQVVIKMGMDGSAAAVKHQVVDEEMMISRRREREVVLVVVTLLSLCIIAAVVFAVIQHFRLRHTGQYELVNMASEPIGRRLHSIDLEGEARLFRHQKECEEMSSNHQKAGNVQESGTNRVSNGKFYSTAQRHTFGPQSSNAPRTTTGTEADSDSMGNEFRSGLPSIGLIGGKLAEDDIESLFPKCKTWSFWRFLLSGNTAGRPEPTQPNSTLATNQEPDQLNGSGFGIPIGFDDPVRKMDHDFVSIPEDETPTGSDGPTPIQNADEGLPETTDDESAAAENQFFKLHRNGGRKMLDQPAAAMNMLPMKIPFASTSTSEKLTNKPLKPITHLVFKSGEQKPSGVDNSFPLTAVQDPKQSMKSLKPETNELLQTRIVERVMMEKRSESDQIEKVVAGKVRFNEKVDVVMTDDEIDGIGDLTGKPTDNDKPFGTESPDDDAGTKLDESLEVDGGVKLTRKNAAEFIKFPPHQNPKNEPSSLAADDYYKDFYQFRNLEGMNSTGQTLLPPKQQDGVLDEDECSSYTVDLDIDDAAAVEQEDDIDPLEPAARRYFTHNVLAELSGRQESRGKKLDATAENGETCGERIPTTSHQAGVPPTTTKKQQQQQHGILFVQGRTGVEGLNDADAVASCSKDTSSSGHEPQNTGRSSLMIEDFWPQSEC